MTKHELSMLLSQATSDHEEKAELISAKYKSLIALADASISDVSDTLGGDMKTSVYIKLALSIISRINCNKMRAVNFKKFEAVEKYLLSLYINRPVETVFLLSFDKSGRLISADKVGEGTVNASTVIPRRILEIAKLRKAESALVAHNHPMGEAIASGDDISARSALESLFTDADIGFLGSYVIADNKCVKIEKR